MWLFFVESGKEIIRPSYLVTCEQSLFVNLLHARVFGVVPCPNEDCYPGTCSSNGATCSCPPGFAGINCNTSRFSCFDV